MFRSSDYDTLSVESVAVRRSAAVVTTRYDQPASPPPTYLSGQQDVCGAICYRLTKELFFLRHIQYYWRSVEDRERERVLLWSFMSISTGVSLPLSSVLKEDYLEGLVGGRSIWWVWANRSYRLPWVSGEEGAAERRPIITPRSLSRAKQLRASHHHWPQPETKTPGASP